MIEIYTYAHSMLIDQMGLRCYLVLPLDSVRPDSMNSNLKWFSMAFY